MLVRVVSLAFLLLVTQIISTTCQDNTESIVETTATTSSTIFNGPLADAKSVGKSITRPSGFTPDESEGINYEGTDKLKDFIQTTRTLDNFTTVSTPVTTTLKSGNNDYVQEALSTEQITVNTDDLEQKGITSTLNLNYLATERILFVNNNETVEAAINDYLHEVTSFPDESNDTTENTTNILSADNDPAKLEENILYDNLDEYIYGDDITKSESTTTNEDVTTETISIKTILSATQAPQNSQQAEQNFVTEDIEDFSITQSNYLSTEALTLQTKDIEQKNEEYFQTSSAITDESLQLLEVTPIEDYNYLSSTHSSSQILEIKNDFNDHNIQETSTADYRNYELIEEDQLRNSTEYVEEPTTIIQTENASVTTALPFEFEVEESIITIPSIYFDHIQSKRNFTVDDLRNSFESISPTTGTSEMLMTETSYQTTEPTTPAIVENTDFITTSSKDSDSDSISTGNSYTEKSITSTSSEDILKMSSFLGEIETEPSKYATQTEISNLGVADQNVKLLEEISANQLTTTDLPVSSMAIDETELPSTKGSIIKQDEFYSEYNENTTDPDQILLTTLSSADNYFDDSKTSSSNKNSLETTTTIIDIWLAEKNMAKSEFDYDSSTSIPEDLTYSKGGLDAIASKDSTNSKVVSTQAAPTISTSTEDITNSETTTIPINLLAETTTLSLDNKVFNEYDPSFQGNGYKDKEKVATFRNEKQLKIPDKLYVTLDTFTNNLDMTKTEVTTSIPDEQRAYDANDYIEPQEKVTATTNLPDFTTFRKDISSEISAYEEIPIDLLTETTTLSSDNKGLDEYGPSFQGNDYKDKEKVATFRNEKQLKSPDALYVTLDTFTSNMDMSVTVTSIQDEEREEKVATTTNLPDFTTFRKDISSENSAYEENLTSTIFSKELVDNGQFTADAINILEDDNYETTVNQALIEDEIVSSTEVSTNDDQKHLNKSQDDVSTSAQDILEEPTMETGKDTKYEEGKVEFTVSLFQESSTEINTKSGGFQNYGVIKESELEKEVNTEEENIAEKEEALGKDANVEEFIRFDTSTDSNEATELYEKFLSTDGITDEKTTREPATIEVVLKIEYEQEINENSTAATNDLLKAREVSGNEEVPTTVKHAIVLESHKEETSTDTANGESTTEIIHEGEEIINNKTYIEENNEEIGNITTESVAVTLENSQTNITKSSVTVSSPDHSQERITEESLFQQDSIITTDAVISSMQELEDLGLNTQEHVNISLNKDPDDFTTFANKFEVENDKEVITESKMSIPFTLSYDEQQNLSKRVFETYIDKTTTDKSWVEHIETISTQKNVVDLLKGDNSDGVEHTLIDRDTRNNTITIDQKDWHKISLNELAEEDYQEEYKEDLDGEDIDKIKLVKEEIVNGSNNDSFIKAVSANYYDDYTSEEYNSSEATDSTNQDDYAPYTLVIPGWKEECIQGNISFRIFIGEHILNIPEDYLVFLNSSEHVHSIVISWKVEDENCNSTLLINVIDDQEDYFIHLVELTHMDNVEAIKSSKGDLELLSTRIGGTMEGSVMIDFENGYQLELVDVNLRLKSDTVVEDPTIASQAKPVISKMMIIIVCATTASCLLLLVIAVILWRKLHTKATVYKMTIE